MKQTKKWIALLLAFVLALSLTGCAGDKPQTAQTETTASTESQAAAGQSAETDEGLTQTAQWLMEQIPDPAYGSVGGEWAVFGLARSDVAVPKEYFEKYGVYGGTRRRAPREKVHGVFPGDPGLDGDGKGRCGCGRLQPAGAAGGF